MFFPELFQKNGFDDFFDRAFLPIQSKQSSPMKTDIKETEKNYQIAVDLPGIQKENVSAEIHDGCLTVNATTTHEDSDQDDKGNYIRRERFAGSYSRSFYVGDTVTEDEIQANFMDGVLHLVIPKKQASVPAHRQIAIN
ncbi:MAG: Hsp20/alpha crystallin family protein [Oscillospiraceae bacterium]|nr:Hsp20/alpha crystallin family protein [Oscillospiraceae bacterium]